MVTIERNVARGVRAFEFASVACRSREALRKRPSLFSHKVFSLADNVARPHAGFSEVSLSRSSVNVNVNINIYTHTRTSPSCGTLARCLYQRRYRGRNAGRDPHSPGKYRLALPASSTFLSATLYRPRQTHLLTVYPTLVGHREVPLVLHGQRRFIYSAGIRRAFGS